MTNHLANLTAARKISRFRFARADGAWAMFFSALLALCAPSAARSATISFQDGVAGYAGESDRQIFDGTPNDGYTRDHIDIAELSADHSRDLVRFDLSSLSSNTVVTGATLSLFVLTETGEMANSLYVLNSAEPWTGSSTLSTSGPASWNDRQASTAWAGGPGLAPTTDYSTSSVAASNTPAAGQWMTLTLSSAGIAAIQDWINTPGDNSGLFLRQDSASETGAAQFAAAINDTIGERPLLTLDVRTVPEPASCVMFALGAGAMLLTAFRRRRV